MLRIDSVGQVQDAAARESRADAYMRLLEPTRLASLGEEAASASGMTEAVRPYGSDALASAALGEPLSTGEIMAPPKDGFAPAPVLTSSLLPAVPDRSLAQIPMSESQRRALDAQVYAASNQLRSLEYQAMQGTLRSVLGKDPEKNAEYARLARAYDVDVDFLVRNEAEVKNELRMSEIADERVMDYAPQLAKRLADERIAAMAHDDVKPLKDEEGWLSFIGRQFTQFPTALEHGWTAAAMQEFGSQMSVGDPLTTGARFNQFSGMSEAREEELLKWWHGQLQQKGDISGSSGPALIVGDMIGQELWKLREKAFPTALGGIVGAAAGGTAGLAAGPFAPVAEFATLPAGLAAGTRAGYAAGAVEQEFRQAAGAVYVRARMDGVDQQTAAEMATVFGIALTPINVALQKLMFPGLSSAGEREALAKAVQARIVAATATPSVRASAAYVARNSLRHVATTTMVGAVNAVGFEAANEASLYAGGLQMRIQTAEGRAEIAQSIVDNTLYMLQAGAAMHVLMPGAQNPVLEAFRERNRIDIARTQQKMLLQLQDFAVRSKLRERSPQDHAELVDAVAESTGGRDLYISKSGLEQVMSDMGIPMERVDEVLPGALAQFRDAAQGTVADRGWIKVNAGEFVTKIGPTEIGGRLLKHVTYDLRVETVDTLMRAKEMRAEIAQDLASAQAVNERLVSEQQAREAQADAVVRPLRDAFKAAGVPDDQADVQAMMRRRTLIASARDAGMSVEEFSRRYPLSVEVAVREAVQASEGAARAPEAAEAPMAAPSADAALRATEAAQTRLSAALEAHGKLAADLKDPDVRRAAVGLRDRIGGLAEAARAAIRSGDPAEARRAAQALEDALPATKRERDAVGQKGLSREIEQGARKMAAAARDHADAVEARGARPAGEAPVLEQAAMSTRVPTAKGVKMAALDGNLLADWDAMQQSDRLVEGNLEKIGALGIPFERDASLTPREQVEQFMGFVADNLEYLYERMDPEQRERARLWYVGGRRLVDYATQRYGITDMQAAAMLAVLSPQKNWFENVSMMFRIADVLTAARDERWSREMEQNFERMVSDTEARSKILERALAREEKPEKPRQRLVDETQEAYKARKKKADKTRAKDTAQYQAEMELWRTQEEELKAELEEAQELGEPTALLRSNLAEHRRDRPRAIRVEGRRMAEDKAQFAARMEEYRKDLEEYERRQQSLPKAIEKAKQKGKEIRDLSNSDRMKFVRKSTLGEILATGDYKMAAYWVRMFDEEHNDRRFAVITPEGGVGGPSMGKDKPMSLRWGSYPTIEKAISVYENGTQENVHHQIGKAHKVRNFYNNLFDPSNVNATTIDTHAIAAALLMPLSASDPAVGWGLGSGVSDSNLGLHGGYAILFEAYKRIADKLGVLPREMQSITWEAIRGLFEAAQKKTMKPQIAAIWERYKAKEIDIARAREEIFDLAGGITTPEWVKSSRDLPLGPTYEGRGQALMDAMQPRVREQMASSASIALEVRPDGSDAKVAAAFDALPAERRLEIARSVAADVVPSVLREFGVDGAIEPVLTVADGEPAQSIVVTMQATPTVPQIVRGLRYVLNQQASFALSEVAFQDSRPVGVVVIAMQDGATPEQVAAFHREAIAPLSADAPTMVGSTMMVYVPEGLDAQAFADTIKQAVASDPRVNAVEWQEAWRYDDDGRASAENVAGTVSGAVERRRLDLLRDAAQRSLGALVAEHGTDVAAAAARAAEPTVLEQAPRAPAQLMAVHNLSEENLAFADNMGGLAVPSIGVVSQERGGVEGFGEITLIGTRPLADPETSRVFESDAYSARFPQAEWPKVRMKTADDLIRPLKDWAAKFDDRRMIDVTWERMVNKPDAQAVAHEWTRSNAIKAMFLSQHGVDVEPIMREAKTLSGLSWDEVERLRPFYEAIDQDMPGDQIEASKEYRNLVEAYAEAFRKRFEALKDEEFGEEKIERIVSSFTGGTMSRISRDLNATERIKVDSFATQEVLDAALEPYRAEFKTWVDRTVREQFDEPFIRIGRTRRPYTLGNIVDAMTSRRVKGEEKGMTFGAGAARAAAANEFSTLEEMRAAAEERMVSPKEYGDARRENETLLETYRNTMLDYFTRTDWRGQVDTWDGLDGAMRALARYGNRARRSPDAMRAALRREGFAATRIPEAVVEQAIDAAVALFTAPVPYFEAKPQRAVRINEFPGAVIPWNASRETREILARNGIVAIEYEPGNEQARQDAVRELTARLSKQNETLFQEAPRGKPRGTYAMGLGRMVLNPSADFFTFAHELTHHRIDVMMQMVRDGVDAPQVRSDVAALLEWWKPGATIESFDAMSPTEREPFYEAVAYSAEIHIATGKAPTPELRPIFQRIAKWMLSVYRDIRGELNAIYRTRYGKDLPILTSEVGSVMDRILFGEESIRAATEAKDLKAMFQTQEESGMSDAEWSAYQDMLQEAHDAAVTDLTAASVRQMQWLGNARSRVLKDMQRKNRALRSSVRDEVEQAVQELPVYRALEFFRRGTVVKDGERVPAEAPQKLDVAAAKALGGEEVARLGYGRYGVLAKDGMHPDVAAELFGFKSGQELVAALMSARKLDEEIDARTDARMLAEHGDLNDPNRLNEAVDRALHNEARARFVAVELRFLAKATQPVDAMVKAAREAAAENISGRRIADIRPRDFVAAEGRFARDAMRTAGLNVDPERAAKSAATRAYNEAMAGGADETSAAAAAAEAAALATQRAQDRLAAHKAQYGDRPPAEVARRAKQMQLFQHQLAAEAIAAREEVAKAIKDLRKVFKADEKIGKARTIEMVHAARAVLASFGLGRADKPVAEYLEQMRSYNPELAAALEPIIAKAVGPRGPRSYKDLTMAEFRAMRDAVEALWTESRRDKQIVVEGRRVSLESVMSELNARLEEIGVPKEIAGERAAPRMRDKAARFLNGVKNQMRRVEHWCSTMDGLDVEGGPFTKYLFRPVKDAMTTYRAERDRYMQRYSDLLATVDMGSERIAAPEIGYVFGDGNGGMGRKELLGALLHSGNESNLRKLLVGREWGTLDDDGNLDASRWNRFVARMVSEGVLTKADFDFVQAVWDLTEEIKPLAQKAHRDLYGFYFKEIEATPLVTPFGTYRGGYVPAKADPFLVSEVQAHAKMDALDGDFRQVMPTTGLGFTKSRVEFNRPLTLDLNLLGRHIDDVLRFSYVQPAIKDATRILKSRQFAAALGRIDPTAVESMMIPWLNRAARNSAVEPGRSREIDRFWTVMRGSTSLAFMSLNLRQLGDVGGLLPAVHEVSATQMSAALAQYLKSPHETSRFIAESSPMMAERMTDQMRDTQDRLREILEQRGAAMNAVQFVRRHGTFLNTILHNQMDIIVWTAAYNEAMRDIGSAMTDAEAHREAVARAEAVVRRTQGSVLPEDVSAFEAGTPFYRTITQFTGYLNTLANLNADNYVKIVRKLGVRKGAGRLLLAHILCYAAPAIIFESVIRGVGGRYGEDEDETWAEQVLGTMFGGYFAGIPGMLPFGTQASTVIRAAAAKAFGEPVPFGRDSISISPTIEVLGSGTVGTADAIHRVATGEDLTGKNIKDTLTLMSVITGVPLTPIGRAVGYAVDVERGSIRPKDEVDYVRGLLTGSTGESTRR